MILAWLGIAIFAYQLWDAMFGPRLFLAVPGDGDSVHVLSKKDFLFSQRVVIVLFLAIPSLCWMYCLTQIVRLSSCFGRGEVLSLGMVGCLQKFGLGLLAMSIGEAAQTPLLATYLIYIKKIEIMKGIWEQLLASGAVTSLMAAVLVLLIARIFRIGIRLREDAELTI
jgi:hypothetical protein